MCKQEWKQPEMKELGVDSTADSDLFAPQGKCTENGSSTNFACDKGVYVEGNKFNCPYYRSQGEKCTYGTNSAS